MTPSKPAAPPYTNLLSDEDAAGGGNGDPAITGGGGQASTGRGGQASTGRGGEASTRRGGQASTGRGASTGGSQVDGDGDLVSTRIIKSTGLEVDGAEFHWWAVGEAPALVTVRSRVFGSIAEFTEDDPAFFATKLARKVLLRHYARAKEFRRVFPTRRRPGTDGEEEP